MLVSDLVKGKDMWKPVGNNQKAVTERVRIFKSHLWTGASPQTVSSTRQPVFS